MGFIDRFAKLPSVDAATARDLVRDGAVLLDVRESNEWNAGHAPQAAHIPLGRINEASKKLEGGKQVVVACRSGNRSKLATKALISMGFNAVNLSGGMIAWAQAGGQVVDRSGRVGAIWATPCPTHSSSSRSAPRSAWCSACSAAAAGSWPCPHW